MGSIQFPLGFNKKCVRGAYLRRRKRAIADHGLVDKTGKSDSLFRPRAYLSSGEYYSNNVVVFYGYGLCRNFRLGCMGSLRDSHCVATTKSWDLGTKLAVLRLYLNATDGDDHNYASCAEDSAIDIG